MSGQRLLIINGYIKSSNVYFEMPKKTKKNPKSNALVMGHSFESHKVVFS